MKLINRMTSPTKLGIIVFAAAGLLATEAQANSKAGSGKQLHRLDNTVVGGEPVPAGKWPDAAGIGSGGQVYCTGVLIAPDVVLTAGHCAGGISTVILGTTDYTSGDAEVINVAREIPYPNWQGTYDITVLVLERESSIKPRPIVPECMLQNDYLHNGADVTIVGYGALDNQGNQYGTKLMQGFTTVADFDCTTSSGCKSAVSPGGELGAGGMGVDSCYGDSGGPLYLTTDRGDFLVGLTSRGYDNNTIDCSQGGIYLRPDAVRDWIEMTTGRTGPPDCPAWPAAAALGPGEAADGELSEDPRAAAPAVTPALRKSRRLDLMRRPGYHTSPFLRHQAL